MFSHLLKIEIGTSGREVVLAGAREATVAAVLGEVDAVRVQSSSRRSRSRGGTKVMRLDGEVAVITGAGGAIGGAQARLLASSGAAIGIADVDLAKAQAMAHEITRAGGRAIASELDVRDPDQWQRTIAATEAAFGPVTVLANNAGANVRTTFDDQTEAMWDLIVDTILKGSFLGIKAAVTSMRRAGHGVIINLGSIASVRPGAMSPGYGAAKMGLVGLTRSAALSYATENIRCVLVSPGHVDTPFLRADTRYSPNDATTSLDNPENYRMRLAATPMGRLMSPEDIARTVRFVISPDAAAITGSMITVDGGAAM